MILCILLVLLILAIINGCSQNLKNDTGFSKLTPILDNLGSSERDIRITSTENYRIKSALNCGEPYRIGQFMENALVLYRHVTGNETVAFYDLNVNLYTDRKTYQKKRRELKLARDGNTGFYSPVPPAAIHMLWAGSLADHPFLTLIHEGFHQYAHHMAIVDRQLNPVRIKPDFPVLIPIWLNEGLAQFVEGAVVTEDQFVPGRIHQVHLIRLQNLIKTKKIPTVKKLLRQRYDEPFSNADYSAAWGVTFALYHGLSSSGKWYSENRLKNYLSKLQDRLLLNERNDNLETNWVEILATESLRVFKQLLLEQGDILADWENSWHFAMLGLDPKFACGGLEPGLY